MHTALPRHAQEGPAIDARDGEAVENLQAMAAWERLGKAWFSAMNIYNIQGFLLILTVRWVV